jgi:hypothetical protein
MPFVPVPNTIEVQSVFELDGQIVENTSYWEKTGGWGAPEISTFLDDVRSVIVEDLLPVLSSTIKLVRMIGTLLDAVDAISLTLSVSPPAAGGDSTDPLPNNASYTVSFLTANRGRSFRGRNYIAGLTNGVQLDGNHVTDTFRSALLVYYSDLRAVGADNGITMVVVSRFSGVDGDGKPIPRTTGVTTPITSFATFDTVIDSQRRRLPGRGQ